MKGYYVEDESGKGLKVPTGRLRIEVMNMLELQELVNQASEEANQLNQTLGRLRNFELNIDFSMSESTSSEL